MKKILIFGCMLVMAAFANTMVSCSSCSDKKVDDISKVPGVYVGEAEIIIPENLKKMVKPDSTGKSPIPDKPVPCKLEIKQGANDTLTIELVDFTLPMKGMEMTPATCAVAQDGEKFTLSGDGSVTFGKMNLTYSHEGTIEGDKIHLGGTVYIIPKILGVNINFNGTKA